MPEADLIPISANTVEPKFRALPDLIGSEVEIVYCSASEKPQKARLVYVKRHWIGAEWCYRGRLHQAHLPREAISMIKQVRRLPRRSRGASR